MVTLRHPTFLQLPDLCLTALLIVGDSPFLLLLRCDLRIHYHRFDYHVTLEDGILRTELRVTPGYARVITFDACPLFVPVAVLLRD